MEDTWLDKVLPAAAALGGMIVSAVIESIRTKSIRAHETKAVFRTKLEALTEAVTDTLQWGDLLLRAATSDELRLHSAPIPPRKVLALCQVYFPELMPQAQELLSAAIEFSDFLTSTPRANLPGSMGAVAVKSDLKAVTRAVGNFRNAREALDKAIATYASTHVRR